MRSAAPKLHVRKHQKTLIFWFPVGASGGLTRPERQSGVSAQVPAQTCNGVAKVSLSFNPSNLAIVTLQLRAPACHRKRSALDQPLNCFLLSSSFFNLILQVSGFYFIFFLHCFCQVLQRRIKVRCFSPAVFLQAVVCVFFTLVSFVRDTIPSCNSEEFVKEASEVPNFLAEVDKCRKICSAGSAELSGQLWKLALA